MKHTAVFFFALFLLLISACASDISADSYQASSVGQTAPVDDGVIVDVRTVNIQGSDSPFGAAAGGVAGGFAASTIGRGKGSVLAAVGGALAGAMLGNFTQKELTEQTALQYFVKLSNGKVVSVIQGRKDPLRVGQKVLVVYGKTTKLIPDNADF